MRKIRYFRQLDKIDCGPTCLKIVSDYYGKLIPLSHIRRSTSTTSEGTSMFSLKQSAERLGYDTALAEVSPEFLQKSDNQLFPCILFWSSNHFVVLYSVRKKRKRFSKQSSWYYQLVDPSFGKLEVDHAKFCTYFSPDDSTRNGYVLFLTPEAKFFESTFAKETFSNRIVHFKDHFLQFKSHYIKILFITLTGAVISFIFPFINQKIVDDGINKNDLHFIFFLLTFQLILFTSGSFIEVIKSRYILYISTRINLSLSSEYLVKLLGLPIAFFESKLTNDIIQRIHDTKKVEEFITSTLLNLLFSTISIITFGAALSYFNFYIFLIFLVAIILMVLWNQIFANRKKEIEYHRFSEISAGGDKVIELVKGINDIKIGNYESGILDKWKTSQKSLFELSVRNMTVDHYQLLGTDLIDQFKNISAAFLSAYLVITNEITLGMMLSISYLAGAISGPFRQIIAFLRQYNVLLISIERLSEIYEENGEYVDNSVIGFNDDISEKNIQIRDLTFCYPNSDTVILERLNFTIPHGKTTAIVGSSGSGKTTLIKILMGLYKVENGQVLIGDVNLADIPLNKWRSNCGCVLQDGYIFSDTVENNITLGIKNKNSNLQNISSISNITEFVEKMPRKHLSKISANGNSLSAGQKQRILIARALYKNPAFIVLDEATSSLDAKNERDIISNINNYYSGKTLLVVAHRLSTILNADQIVVLEGGMVSEIGNHFELLSKKGTYFNLIKSQLPPAELGAQHVNEAHI